MQEFGGQGLQDLEEFDTDDKPRLVKQEFDGEDQESSEISSSQITTSKSNEDFKKWLDLVQKYQIDQYAKKTLKSIKNWFTLIPNEEDMKKSAFR